MQAPQWLHNWTTIVLSALLLPPLGLILLWTRSRTKYSRKIVSSIYILVWGVVYLHQFFGLRIELDGTGRTPILSFRKQGEAHYAELDFHRARQARTFSETQPIRQPKIADTPQVAVSNSVKLPTQAVATAASSSETRLLASEEQPQCSTWPDFRGPRRDGHYACLIMPEWPASGLSPIWKQPIGGGYASFVVAEARVFTIEQRRQEEVVTAYELETGRELWASPMNAEFRETMGGDGPRATPTWNDGRLYALGALGDLRCLDPGRGQEIWRVNILQDNRSQNLPWGMSASPLIVDDKVIVLPGGQHDSSVVAYDKKTGAPAWKALDDVQAYTSPMLVNLAGRRQVLVVSATRVVGLDPNTGSLIWDFPWQTANGINSAQPVLVSGDQFFISAGYGHGAALIEVSRSGEQFLARALWQTTAMKNKFNTSVYYEGNIYGMDESILTCIDARTGERRWKQGRYGYGQLLLAGDTLIVLTESGELVLVKATPSQHSELARFQAISGKTWNHPALAAGRLLVRNGNEMACFRISPD